MTYIPDVNADSDIVVVNGNFAVDANWSKTPEWTIAGGKAVYVTSGAENEDIEQNLADLVLGNVYEITFTLSNNAWSLGIDGLVVYLGNSTNGILYRTDNTFTAKIIFLLEPKKLIFRGDFNTPPGNCDLDNISIVPLTSYAESELEINWRRPQAAVVYPVAGGDRIYHQLSYRDKTNCIIKYTP